MFPMKMSELTSLASTAAEVTANQQQEHTAVWRYCVCDWVISHWNRPASGRPSSSPAMSHLDRWNNRPASMLTGSLTVTIGTPVHCWGTPVPSSAAAIRSWEFGNFAQQSWNLVLFSIRELLSIFSAQQYCLQCQYRTIKTCCIIYCCHWSCHCSYCSFTSLNYFMQQFACFLKNCLNPNAHCCHMGTDLKHPVPHLVKPSFVIFDIRALWHSALSVRVPGCQKLQMTA